MRPDRNTFLQAATTIAYKICRDAIWVDDRCNWITSHVEDFGGYPKTYFHSLDGSLYCGTSGIAHFLSSLHTVYADPIIKATCYGALKQALSQLQEQDKASSMSFFSGKLGTAYVAIKAGQHFNDQALIDEGVSHLLACLSVPLEQCGLDVIDGCAGALPVMLNLYEDLELDSLRESAIAIGEYILAKAQDEPVGISWETTPFQKHNLTGFAHGAAGIACALFELYQLTGMEKYKVAATNGILYENAHFNDTEKNWPDFRTFNETTEGQDATTPCSCAWCHGAPGIGLSRLRAFAITGEEQFKHDALAAIDTTLKNNNITPYSNFSLCHGLFGNAELLLEAGDVLDDPAMHEAAVRIGNEGITNYINMAIPFTNGVNNTFDNPELMTGNAGVGYFYLRLFDAGRFRSVLQVGARQVAVVRSQ